MRQEYRIRDYQANRDIGTVFAVSERGALNAASRQGMWTRFITAIPANGQGTTKGVEL